MKITAQVTDQALLKEIGLRLARQRLESNQTQAMVAESAGISKRTLERMEAGEVAVQLSQFLRVCRSLGLLERLELLLPEPVPGPMELLRMKGRERRRARRPKADGRVEEKWTWGDGT
jgi:transcriptional regulator with XRE-family HTH domain